MPPAGVPRQPQYLRNVNMPDIGTCNTHSGPESLRVGSGLQAWGGGSVCQEYAEGLPPVQIDCRLPDASGAFTVNGTCFAAAKTSYCTGNGEVELRFGSPEYVGLGALVFLLLVLLETFGSPFMRNCEVSHMVLHPESWIIGLHEAACMKRAGMAGFLPCYSP